MAGAIQVVTPDFPTSLSEDTVVSAFNAHVHAIHGDARAPDVAIVSPRLYEELRRALEGRR